ncbi:MAG TPA: RNA polymerase factor sigma-54 [Candidatus Competibacteraceae bacterium]|nr:RNA polymerase factor sigma-54 [Candidatus Competibacteraceae bacterium]
MKQSLQLRLGQQLTMTPQLQQAIRLLQLSSLDLQTEIQTVLESNLMLERVDEGMEESSPGSGFEAPESAPAEAAETGEAAGDELAVDSDWDASEDFYDGATAFSTSGEEDEFDPYARQAESQDSLRDYLLWQMELTPFSPTDLAIATAIIDAINDDGYLTLSLEEIRLGLQQQLGLELDPDEVEAVLHRVQRFDPPGVAARDPAECLLLQLDQFPADTPWREQARCLIRQHLELLAARDFNTLMRRLKVSREELAAIVALIQTLNPHPGDRLSQGEAQYVVPDVFVIRQAGGWRVSLNPESAPRLRINPHYASLVRRADSSADNACLRTHLQEARWFLKSLQNRNQTLLKVATCIVEHQRKFLEHGEEYMKPLVLRDIAEALEMHESTISRVTTQKYMHTPRGIYEFKYFFSSHVGTSDGGECSSVAIRAMIKKLISAENPQKPLSDSKIAQLLDKEGIQVARRTVAKYREAMAIPPSSERKRLT